MVRSASKNFESVAVVTDPADYPALAKEFSERGDWSLATRLELARKAFAATARYDGRIATELERLSITDGKVTLSERPSLPARLHIALASTRRCATAKTRTRRRRSIFPRARRLPGWPARGSCKARNFLTTILWTWTPPGDWRRNLRKPAAVIVKHNNPCGTAEQPTLAEAYRQALACDPVSAFGGVLAFNRPLDGETAGEVGKLFAECVVAPGYDGAARAALSGKKNLRLMEIDADEPAADTGWELKRISGGVLVQEPDTRSLSESELKVVTKRQPTREEIDSTAIRVEGRQAREVECHRLRCRWAHAGRGSRAR